MKPITKFGISQIGKTTPTWATYTFRIIFLLLSFGSFMISDYPGIDESTKAILVKWFSGINMLTWGLSKLFGVEQLDHPSNSKP